MNRIRAYFARRREEYQKQLESAIRADFTIEERNSEMWLMHKGTAIRKFDQYAKANEITEMLNEARECAIEFERV